METPEWIIVGIGALIPIGIAFAIYDQMVTQGFGQIHIHLDGVRLVDGKATRHFTFESLDGIELRVIPADSSKAARSFLTGLFTGAPALVGSAMHHATDKYLVLVKLPDRPLRSGALPSLDVYSALASAFKKAGVHYTKSLN